MTSPGAQPDWEATEVPQAASAAVILAAEHAADARAHAASVVMADAAADPAWLRVVAARTLAGLLAGPTARTGFDKLSEDVHHLAAEAGAPDEQVRLSLAAIALSEAYERGALGRCDELVSMSEFSDRDIACAAAVLAGHVVAYLAGEHATEVFAGLRQRHGLGGAS